MSDPFQGPAPPPGGPGPRSTPIGGEPGYGAPPPGFPQGPGPAGSPPGHGQPPPGYGQPPIGQPGWTQPPKRGTNGLAIAGFVLGLLWVCTIGSILGIIFGFVALSQIKHTQQSGRGFAIAGIVLGFIGIAATAAITIIAVNTADDVFKQVPGEVDDVSLVSCERTAEGTPQAVLEFANDSTKTSFYVVGVEFRSSGATTTESELNGADLVDPGETVRATVNGTEKGSGDVRCEITYVQRFASEAD